MLISALGKMSPLPGMVNLKLQALHTRRLAAAIRIEVSKRSPNAPPAVVDKPLPIVTLNPCQGVTVETLLPMDLAIVPSERLGHSNEEVRTSEPTPNLLRGSHERRAATCGQVVMLEEPTSA